MLNYGLIDIELHRGQQISYKTPLFKDFSTGAFKDGRTVFWTHECIFNVHLIVFFILYRFGYPIELQIAPGSYNQYTQVTVRVYIPKLFFEYKNPLVLSTNGATIPENTTFVNVYETHAGYTATVCFYFPYTKLKNKIIFYIDINIKYGSRGTSHAVITVSVIKYPFWDFPEKK